MYEKVANTLRLPAETVRRAVWWAEYKAAGLRRPNGLFLSVHERRIAARLHRHLLAQQQHVLDSLASLSVFREKGVYRVHKKALGDELKRLADGLPDGEEMATAITAAASVVMLKGGRNSVKKYKLAKFGISFDLTNIHAVQYLSGVKTLHLSDRQGSIDKTTKDHIIDILRNGINDGSTYTEMSKVIREQADEGIFSKARAQAIAVHETAKAYEFGNREPLREYEGRTGDQVYKKWVTVGDDKVTPECAENEDQGWILLDVPFKSGHATPPRFPNVHCRCTTAYEFASTLHLVD